MFVGTQNLAPRMPAEGRRELQEAGLVLGHQLPPFLLAPETEGRHPNLKKNNKLKLFILTLGLMIYNFCFVVSITQQLQIKHQSLSQAHVIFFGLMRPGA